VIAGFDMPVAVTIPGRGDITLHPTAEWQRNGGALASLDGFSVDVNYYVTAKAVTP
jgi:hypothetical protein